jgi:hypothetical protein
LVLAGCAGKGNPEGNAAVDLDLTELSVTVLIACLDQINETPEDYMGKTIKMSGAYYALYSEETDTYYHYAFVTDTAACCVKGLEFLWNGEHNFPDDYPEETADIEITGVFNSYEEFGQAWYYLAVDDISVL